MKTLAIDTSTNILGVAILDNTELIGQKVTKVNKDHSSRLIPAIVELMKDINMKPEALEKIVVGAGPGSFTGNRIGVTVAKSLAWTLNIQVVRVSNLVSLAYQAKLKDGIVCSFFDARRENIYAKIYRVSNNQVTTIKPDSKVTFSDLTENLLSFNEEITLLSHDIKKFDELMSEDFKKQTVITDITFHIIKQ